MKKRIEALFDTPSFIEDHEEPVLVFKLKEMRKLIHLEVMHFLTISGEVEDVEDYISRFGHVVDLVLAGDVQTKNINWFELKKNFEEISGQFKTVDPIKNNEN